MNIDEASQELGKSLAKMMNSEKYSEFSYQQCISILTNARNNAIAILQNENGPNIITKESLEQKIEEEYTRGENQN